MSYEVIIPIVKRNIDTLSTTILQLKRHLDYQKIVCIGNSSLKDECTKLGCEFLDEDSVLDGMTYEKLEHIISEIDFFAKKRTGWYLQQFLKLGYSRICESDFYLSWDADTLLVNDISMFSVDKKPFFDIKHEYNRPYFSTLNRLFNGKVKKHKIDESFISEHMLFNADIVKEMLSEIEDGCKSLKGNVFEKIIKAVDPIDLAQSGFSEFETYGNYVMTFYPEMYRIRELRSLREGNSVYGKEMNERDLLDASSKYDIVTLENRYV